MEKREPKTLTKTGRIFKKRPCRLCKEKATTLDYKNVDLLRNYVSDRGRIITARLTGNCAKHQRMVSNGIKRARIAGLMSFVKIKEGAPRRRTRREE